MAVFRVKRRLLVALPLLGGCSLLGEWRYRARAVGGHLDLLARAQPIDRLLAQADTPEALQARLRMAQRLRRFAVEHLALPDNASYTRYVDLQADAVVWNVVAAPAHSLSLRTWCFPLMGCVGYRGYWDRSEADRLAEQLKAQGWDVYQYGVPAYSTLGYSNPLGGDPLLSTFLRWGEPELARLLFHELAHQKVYAADDTAFNESYATAVERLGLQAWWRLNPNPTVQQQDAQQAQRRERWRALALAAKADLQALYASQAPDKPSSKRERLAQLRADIDQLAQADAGFSGYAAWARQANNAHLALLSAYASKVPGFEALFARLGSHWPNFHTEVARLAAQPRSDREKAIP
jgi:predicted aminopeptidase